MKECGEEASIPEPLARAARPAGMITYMTNMEQGLKPDVLFCYDLKLPADFVPKPADGEVRGLGRWWVPSSRVTRSCGHGPAEFCL